MNFPPHTRHFVKPKSKPRTRNPEWILLSVGMLLTSAGRSPGQFCRQPLALAHFMAEKESMDRMARPGKWLRRLL